MPVFNTYDILSDVYNSTNHSLKTQVVGTSGVPANVDVNGNLSVQSNAQTVFGDDVNSIRYNQVEVHFDNVFDAGNITNTTSGGGTATQANGHALYSTGTATTASAKAVSVQSVSYRSANEVYSYFTAAFTTPTSANSNQRLGLYDANNGFFLGFNGTTFGVTLRSGAVDTFTARSSWNGDPLDGSASSKFTRNGVPEAVILTFSNLWRIRFGWLGSANVIFEIYSPDGDWVTFHTLRIPNSQLNPSIQNPDLGMTLEVTKTAADATSLTMATGCWAAGTTSDLQHVTDTVTDYTLAKLTRSIIVGKTTGGGGGYVAVKVNPSGAVTTEANVTQFGGSNIATGAGAGGAGVPRVTVSNDSYTVSSSSAVTSVSSSATSVTLLASNSSRRGAVFFNDSTQVCYLKFGATASSTSYTVAVASQSLFIIDSNPIYTGIIDGIWASANGAMRITELT